VDDPIMTNLLSRIYDFANGAITADVDNASTKTDTLEAGEVTNGPIYTGGKNGSDADDRLTTALSDASDGDQIILENANYSEDRTITTPVTFSGLSTEYGSYQISGVWTIDVNYVTIENAYIGKSTTVTLNGICKVKDGIVDNAIIEVDDVECEVSGNESFGSNINLTSNSSDCAVFGNRKFIISNSGTNNEVFGNV
jgi:hypothetical protein